MSDVTSKQVAVTATSGNGKVTMVKGYTLLARALRRLQVDSVFYLMGGPMGDAETACVTEGIRMIDVRHEQAAALMAQAYARVRAKPGVCIGCSGPGSINLTTGLANALIDCAPVLALGGASPMAQFGKGAFQEIDQLAIMRPVTKWAERVYETRRIPELIDLAYHEAMSGKPGPVYLDFPGDILYKEVPESEVVWARPIAERKAALPAASSEAVAEIGKLLADAKRPILVTGSGIWWSHASGELERFVEITGIPFYTTPQGRGVVPEDSEFFYGAARTTAFKEADLVLIVGTRENYVIGHARPPRFSEAAKFVRIDIDPDEIAASDHLELGVVGDAKAVLAQLVAALEKNSPKASYSAWREKLGKIEQDRRPKNEAKMSTDQMPIHPLRLCKEVRDFIDRDGILCVDGQEILNFGRQSIPSYRPGHRLNSGPFGTMGVGMPFGVGAKAGCPDKQVIVLHGDGSFAMNGFELDTAVRHKLPLIVIISLNGGWTGDHDEQRTGSRLGYTRYDKIAEALGCYAEYVERPEQIRPALDRAAKAVAEGKCALINVVTDDRASAETAAFSAYRAV